MTQQKISDIIKESICESQMSKHSRKEWTKNIKKKIALEARKENLYVCSSGLNQTNWGQWLYDLVVIKYDENTKYMENTILVLESEWNYDDKSIFEDFQKLLLSNSDFKVMVFYKNKEAFSVMYNMISSYKKSNGKFIFAFLPANNSELEITIKNGNIA